MDDIGFGGPPVGRSTLISGTAGSGKTLFGIQFLIGGLEAGGDHGVLVTFEEPAGEISKNVAAFGWDLDRLVAEKRLAIVDASRDWNEEVVEFGEFDFGALIARIRLAVESIGARRLVLDSVGSLFPQFADAVTVRRELSRVLAGLREIGATSLVTIERAEDSGLLSRFGVEEFVADGMIVLRNTLVGERRRRTVEITKLRGVNHGKGEYPYTIGSTGITVLPLSAINLTKHASVERISLGIDDLDVLCAGGVFRDAVTLVSGATGAGKTLMGIAFAHEAVRTNERSLYLSFEESAEQLYRNGSTWGIDLEGAVASGHVRVICRYPERMGLEDLLVEIGRDIEEAKPTRVVVDSLSALTHGASPKAHRELVGGLISIVKQSDLAAMFTMTTGTLLGVESLTDAHVSTMADVIVLLRYFELEGQLRRAITVVKERASAHTHDIREYTIDGSGFHVGESVTTVQGLLGGAPSRELRGNG